MGLWLRIRLGSRLLRRAALFAVGIASLAKLGSAGMLMGSMLVSLALYAWAFGWRFAVGLIVVLFVHELGHVIAAYVVGLRPSVPVFVPFVGAVISLRQPPRSAKMAANVAVGGPAVGTLSALLFLAGYFWTDSILLLVLAYTAAIINLFNLIPLAPLDGGRIAAAILPYMWGWGGFIAAGVFFYTRNLIVLVIFVISLYYLWKGEDMNNRDNYYALSLHRRFKVACWYFGLVSVLGIVMIYAGSILY
ncbi:MAG: hypothetical protein H6Q75_1729 [Firmicutes bacterium]|nr:hypothetical protein [Bacillota bacterium]